MKNDDLRTLLIAMAIVFVMAVSALLGYGALKFLGPTVKNTISSIEDTIRGKAETEEIVEVPEDTSDDDADKEDAEDVKDAEDDVTAEEIPDQPVTSYKVQNTRDYNGPRICQAHSYIYNSDGKVVDDFHDEDTYYLEMTLNVDASEAILVYDDTCYYIDADLNITEIAKNVRDAGMCYDGGYFYYCQEGRDYYTDLYIYDVKKGEASLIESDAAKYICISPDGRTLAFFD